MKTRDERKGEQTMKERYETPELEIITFKTEDVIVTSTQDTGEPDMP